MKKQMLITDDISRIANGYGSAPWFGQQVKKLPDALVTEILAMMKTMFEKKFTVEIAPSKDIVQSIKELISMENPNIIISAEPAYIDQEDYKFSTVVQMDLSMGMPINPNEKKIGGDLKNKFVPRWGAIKNGKTTDDIIAYCAEAATGKNAIFADEVVFTGETAMKAINLLNQNGANIETVVTYVATVDGKRFLEKNGIDMKAAYYISAITGDTVDARDMLLFPQGGRTVLDANGNIAKQPRFLPFGSPRKRFGISRLTEKSFSENFIYINRYLFQIMEEINAREISTTELPEPILNMRPSSSIAKELRRLECQKLK